MSSPAGLVLGPLLRWVDAERAVIWVETDRPCAVTVLGASAATFQIHHRHYSLVVVEGLTPGTATPYDVRLDGRLAWPPAGTASPQIRTPGRDGATRVAFGSCRMTVPDGAWARAEFGPDALAAYARALRDPARTPRPDLLLLVGDQVYADEVHPGLRRFVHRRARAAARRDRPPASEAGDSRSTPASTASRGATRTSGSCWPPYRPR